MIELKDAEEAKSRYRTVAYQSYLNGNAEGKTFDQYLRQIGLHDQKQVDKDKLREEIKHSYSVAEKIIALRDKTK